MSITMEKCDALEDDRCVVSKGDTVRGQLTFKASKTTKSLKCEIYGVILGIPVPMPGGCPIEDACTSLTKGDCPVESGETFQYDIELLIDQSFPTVSYFG